MEIQDYIKPKYLAVPKNNSTNIGNIISYIVQIIRKKQIEIAINQILSTRYGITNAQIKISNENIANSYKLTHFIPLKISKSDPQLTSNITEARLRALFSTTLDNFSLLSKDILYPCVSFTSEHEVVPINQNLVNRTNTNEVEQPNSHLINGNINFCSREFFSELEIKKYFPCVPLMSSNLYPLVDTFKDAIEVFKSVDNQLYSWLTNLIGLVVFVKSNVKYTESGSSAEYPHLIYLSAEKKISFIIDTLIHEGTHQLLLYSEYIFPFYKKNEKLYFNPIIQRKRPIKGILAAYHAFSFVANHMIPILPFLCGDERYEAEQKIERLKKHLPILEKHLENSGELTLYGLNFYLAIKNYINGLSN